MTPAELSAILFDAIDYDGNDPHTKQSHRAQGYAELYGGDTVDLNKVAQAVHDKAIAPLIAENAALKDRIAELEGQVDHLSLADRVFTAPADLGFRIYSAAGNLVAEIPPGTCDTGGSATITMTTTKIGGAS